MNVLEPYANGRLRLANRLSLSATVTNLGRNDAITDRQIAFYAERARDGVGLIVTEGLAVHPSSIPNETVPLAYERELVPQFARLATAVHAHGRTLVGQLWHAGRQALWNPMQLPWSASSERDPYSGSTPHAMTDDEVIELIDAYAASAANLQAAGFDGVELHGAHGYLLTQFLSPWSNLRADRWGGPVENRARIVTEIVRSIRARCGDGLVVGLKLTVDEGVPNGLDLVASQELVAHLVAAQPPDYLSVSQGNFSPSLEWHVPDLTFRPAHFRHLHRGIREVAAGVPVLGLGKIGSVALAQELVAAGDCDLVGMSRALLADPRLVAKAARGEEPRPCTYCNVCWHQIHTLRPVQCFYAPEAPESGARDVAGPVEEIARIGPAERREVHVAGSGPAGLEVARVAAARGHVVVVHESSAQVGGRLAVEARLPGRAGMGEAPAWLAARATGHGADIRLGRALDPSSLPAGAVVVQATGALAVVEPLPGVDLALSLEDAIRDPGRLVSPVLVVDEIDDEPVYAACEAFAAAGREVLLVTRRPVLGRHVPWVSMLGVLRRLDAAGIDVHITTAPRRVEGGALVVAHSFSGRDRELAPVRSIVRAGPYRPAEPLETGGRELHVVGDAVAPRGLLPVVLEAHRLARSL